MSNIGKFAANKTHLRRVDVVKASIDNPLEMLDEKIESFNFRLDYGIGFNLDDKIVKTELEVSLKTDLKESRFQAESKFKLAFLFGIDNFDELVHPDADGNKGVKVSDDLAFELTAISYSTARGILLTRFQGTIFKDFILPVMDPDEILNQTVASDEEA